MAELAERVRAGFWSNDLAACRTLAEAVAALEARCAEADALIRAIWQEPGWSSFRPEAVRQVAVFLTRYPQPIAARSET